MLLLSAIGYGLVGTFLGGWTYAELKSSDYPGDLFTAAFLAGLAWPLSIVAGLGIYYGLHRFQKAQKRKKIEAKLEEEHQLALDAWISGDNFDIVEEE